MRKLLVAAGALALVLGGAALGVWLWDRGTTSDVRGSSTTEFVVTDEPGTETRPAVEQKEMPWPTYGYVPARTQVGAGIDLRPPFRKRWMVRGRNLIEFPPVVAYGRLYVGTNPGRFLAIEAQTGVIAWEKAFKRCIAASPTVADGVVYQPLMDPSPCGNPDRAAPGYMVAMAADTGRVLWRFQAGVIESSPVLVDGVLFFGSWDRNVYALDVATHKPRWTFETGDEVKAAAAYANGTIYIGSYDGKLYAIDARTGEERWASEGRSGVGGGGNFYATAAVAYGRVFIGSTDGKVYAFGAKSGDLLWAQSTGGFVYSSAAVYRETVYVGSYDGNLYALDAATGDVRWTFATGGRISGAATVISGIVYVSTLEEKTFALDAETGEQVWSFPDGKYTPIVADAERAYLVGYTRVYGLVPTRP
ncbi:MAG TPA: PQQ-binding-like beta-propeller repeat protein [Desertimonas sp.]|nr:PQQ-binding-like beta-propeller repeat protein [Desertimonas sp.]